MPEPRPPATPPPLSPTVTGGTPPIPPDSPTVSSPGPPAGDGPGPGMPDRFGRYRVVRLLGRGGMGTVFLAHDTHLDRPVALKIPAFRGTLTPEQKERFFREARAVAALRHPNICPVFDVGEEQGILYLTTAYIDGHTLATALKDGPMDQLAAAALVRKVALAMQAAHNLGTIHRDLKPANIMLDRSGEPVVMDFGLARKGESDDLIAGPEPGEGATDSALTQQGSILGTPAYMPPEQATGDLARIGPRSDVYALGAVLYECLTGRRPFDGPDAASILEKIRLQPPPPPRDHAPDLDPALERVCLKALERDPDDRHGSMADLAAGLKDVIDPELRVVVPPPLPSARRARPVRRRRWWVTPLGCLAALTMVLLVCVGGPLLVVRMAIDWGGAKLNEIQQGQERANAEWQSVLPLWQPPPADAPLDVLFPPTLSDNYRRARTDQGPPDLDLGIQRSGRRAFYTGPDGTEYEVRAYRYTDAEAVAILAQAYRFTQSVQSGTATAASGPGRQKALYAAQNTGQRTVTYAFADESNQNQEYGKLWNGQGWLFLFRTKTPLAIEYFPPHFLLGVMTRTAGSSKSASETTTDPKRDGKPPGGGQLGNQGK